MHNFVLLFSFPLFDLATFLLHLVRTSPIATGKDSNQFNSSYEFHYNGVWQQVYVGWCVKHTDVIGTQQESRRFVHYCCCTRISRVGGISNSLFTSEPR